MALSRVTTWAAGNTLTAAALNGEFNNILNNPIALISPFTGNVDVDGQDLLDADELEFRDAAANATAVGRLRRNGLNLTYHDSTGAVALQPLVGGLLFGCTLSNGPVDTTNDINFAIGSAVDSTEATTIRLTSALVKQIDAAWAVGTNAGGLFSGVVANDTWYHCFIIRRNDTGVVDAGFDTSVTAANIPTNYNVFRRVGSIRRGTATNLAFTQDNDYFRLSASILDVNVTGPGSTAVTRTLTVPTGINIFAIYNALWLDNATTTAFLISDLAANDEAPSNTAAPLGTLSGLNSATVSLASENQTRTNTSAQVRTRAGTADVSAIIRIATLGWMDPLGRAA